MGGSQLRQLKARLKDAGLSRDDVQDKKKGKQRRMTPEVRAARLADIQSAFNRYGTQHSKPKFAVGGRNITGTSGKPAQSKSVGLENRKKTLLPELLDRHREGGIVDRRFGENNPTLTPEEKSLERFSRERQRRAGKMAMFNLDDDDEIGGLTHLGQTLSNSTALPEKDVHAQMLETEDREEGPPRKKSKSEVMEEVIAKSKAHKADRQRMRNEDDDVRTQLDRELSDLRHLLGVPAGAKDARKDHEDVAGAEDHALSSNVIDGAPDLTRDEAADAYDRFVKELAFEPRVEEASNRMKTDEEKALDAKRKLEAAEAARLKRMRGEGDAEIAHKRKRSQADDLDDDFMDDSAGPFGLGRGLGIDEPLTYVVDADGNARLNGTLGPDSEGADESEGDDTSGLSPEDDDEAGSEDSDDQADEEGDGGDSAEPDIDGLLSEASTDELDESAVEPLVRPSSKALGKQKELAFTFDCPATHEDLLDILATAGDDPDSVATVVQRIRTQYHPKLGNDNKEKMENFLGLLFDHALHVTAQRPPRFDVVEALIPHIFALSTSCPLAAAEQCRSRLVLMQKNLLRGLQQGPSEATARTWPGLPELTLLRLIGLIWSTSDQSHPVSAPAQLLMGQYLAQCRLRRRSDLVVALFLCTLILQYEDRSKRLVPEAISFLASSILILFPHAFSVTTLPGSFPVADAFADHLSSLRVTIADADTDGAANSFLLGVEAEDARTVPLARVALDLLSRFAASSASNDAFIELFSPIASILDSIDVDDLPPTLKARLAAVSDDIARMLRLARSTRRPLLLQQHRAVPIASHVPKFDTAGAGARRSFDPDPERAEASKLRALYRKERKGAVRELRKDARFVAEERAKAQRATDAAYRQKISKITSGLQVERGEQKGEERRRKRDKARDRRRR